MSLIRMVGIALALGVPVWTSAWAGIPSASEGCVAGLIETTPSSDFTVLEEGAVVRHITTGLEWRRCAEGMNWTGTACEGEVRRMTWYEALQHADGQGHWRVPNIKELRSIVEYCRQWPSINEQVFPELWPYTHWTASPYRDRSVLGVDFGHGVDLRLVKDHQDHLAVIRLVRGGYR